MTKEKLEEYIGLIDEIHEMEEELLVLESDITKMTASYSSDPHSTSMSGDKLSDNVCRLISFKNKINEKIILKYHLKEEIEECIGCLDVTSRRLMRYRYIKGIDMSAISKVLKYSRRQVTNIHCAALKKLNDTMDIRA
jgi:DNA-directed RNA polymerase specialized sigma subunit